MLVTRHTPPNYDTPTITTALLNNKAGGFNVAPGSIFKGGAPLHIQTAFMVVADFNGDGLQDVFVPEPGVDRDPYPGGENSLMLGKKGGGLINASAKLPDIVNLANDADAADIDGDGDVDIVVIVAAEPFLHVNTEPYFLINDGKANFSLSPHELEPRTTNVGPFKGAFIDVDEDGDQDLYLGGEAEYVDIVHLNDGGRFTPSPHRLPERLADQIVDCETFDFNRDGLMDILSSQSARHEPGKEAIGRLQVLQSKGNGRFVDATDKFIDDQPPAVVPEVFFVDLNKDGAEDIVVQGQDFLYLNDGANRFHSVPWKLHDGNAAIGAKVIFDINNDGWMDFMTVGSAPGDPDYLLRTFTMKPVDAGLHVGSSKRELMLGGPGSQTFDGRGGSDVLAGGNGDDVLDGGIGRDKLLGGKGIDTATYLNATGGVAVNLAAKAGTLGEARGDVLATIENLIGSRFADSLTGSAGANSIDGGGGADHLLGKGGPDRFVFADVSHSANRKSSWDTIGDFKQAQGDRVDLVGIDANAGTTANNRFRFIGEAAFTGTPSELRYDTGNRKTFVLADVDGDGKADLKIEFTGRIDFAKGDFVV